MHDMHELTNSSIKSWPYVMESNPLTFCYKLVVDCIIDAVISGYLKGLYRGRGSLFIETRSSRTQEPPVILFPWPRNQRNVKAPIKHHRTFYYRWSMKFACVWSDLDTENEFYSRLPVPLWSFAFMLYNIELLILYCLIRSGYIPGFRGPKAGTGVASTDWGKIPINQILVSPSNENAP
jgi:hypothetical protein